MPRRFCAFISYRHADNAQEGRRWAEWLHRALERYVVPPDLIGTPNGRNEPVPASLYPIFRDEDELPANADLAAGIRAALEVSDHLIVICSPRSAVSPWVRKEVKEFKEFGRSDRILAVMIAGEPNADDPAKAREGILPEEECFCDKLRFGVVKADGTLDWTTRTEPLAADLRPGGLRAEGFVTADAYREHLALTTALAPEKIASLVDAYRTRLESGLLKIVAGLVGLPLGQLTERDATYRAALAEAEVSRQRDIAERERALADKAEKAAKEAKLAAEEAQIAKEHAEEWARRLKERNLVLKILISVALGLVFVAGGFWWQAGVQKRKAENLNAQAARSAQVAAEQGLREGEQSASFAYLAHAINFRPESTLAAETAVAALNDWHSPPPVAICRGHRGKVESAQFSADGSRVVTASHDKTACVWEVSSGSLVFELRGHKGAVWSARFSEDQQRVVTASLDGTARVWNARDGQSLLVLSGHTDAVTNARFSSDGRYILTCSNDRTARVWDAATGQSLAKLPHQDILWSAQFSPDARWVVTGSEDKIARVWESVTGKLLAELARHGDAIWSAHFSPDGNFVVTSSLDRSAMVWDWRVDQEPIKLTGHGNRIWCADFDHSGRFVVTASDDQTARMWNAKNGSLLATFPGRQSPIECAQFSKDGLQILAGSHDTAARIWDVNGRLLATLVGHARSASFSSDGQWVVSASEDNAARIWDVRSQGLLTTLTCPDGPVDSVRFASGEEKILVLCERGIPEVWNARNRTRLSADFKKGFNSPDLSPDGELIVTATNDKTAVVLDSHHGRQLAVLSGHDDRVTVTRFSPDGQSVVTVSNDMTARIWEAISGQLITTLRGHLGALKDAQFSPDGQRIVTISIDNTARVWESRSGKLLAVVSGHGDNIFSAQFDPAGERIVTVMRNGTAQLWDARSGRKLARLSSQIGSVTGVQFSPSGEKAVTALAANFAQVWDTKSGALLVTLSGHDHYVTGARFSPDGERIVTVSWDKTARLWDAQSGRMLATFLSHEHDVVDAQFDASGQRIVTASKDGTVRLWTVLSPKAGRPPQWFRDFLEYLGQRRINHSGESELLSDNDWLAVQEKLRGVLRSETGKVSPYLSVLRKFVREE